MSIKVHRSNKERKRYRMFRIINSNPDKKYLIFYINKTNTYSYCSIFSNGRTINTFSSIRYKGKNLTKMQAAERLGLEVISYVRDNNLLDYTFVYDLSGFKNHGIINKVLQGIKK